LFVSSLNLKSFWMKLACCLSCWILSNFGSQIFFQWGFFDPIDFSGIVGYPHDISEDAIDNIPEFRHGHASDHIVIFTKFIEKWCDPPIYEDVLMQLFVFTLVRDREMFWFQDSLDNIIQNHTGFVAYLLGYVWAWSAGGS
jgi:hypothetical protein